MTLKTNSKLNPKFKTQNKIYKPTIKTLNIMKKFISKIMFAAVAILSVAGFTSCNNTDDDPYVPTQMTVQEQPKYEVVPTYVAILSADILNIYDVTVVLHSGAQSKEVALTKANGETKDNVEYKYIFSDVDGQKGVTSVEAMVTPKADAKTIIENMPADDNTTLMFGSDLVKASYDANGKLMNDKDRLLIPNIQYYMPCELLMDWGNGELIYEYHAQTLEMYLTE